MAEAYYRKTPQQALEAQKAAPAGLSGEEVRRRTGQYGPNKLSEGKKKSVPQIFFEQFKDLLVVILLIAAVISALSENVESTIVIFAVLVLNAILGTAQYVKAEKSLESLKAMSAPSAKVLRGGVRLEIPSADVVPGQNVQVLGLVRGNIVTSRHIGRDMMAGMKELVGGEIKSYTEMTDQARTVAEGRMIAEAERLGADAVVAMRFSSGSINPGTIEMLAYGTAVKFV